MNERIMEYAEQARLHAQKIYPEVKDIKDWGRLYHEKFAELIVQECVGLVNEQLQHNNPNDSLLALKIKEHFGVEE